MYLQEKVIKSEVIVHTGYDSCSDQKYSATGTHFFKQAQIIDYFDLDLLLN